MEIIVRKFVAGISVKMADSVSWMVQYQRVNVHMVTMEELAPIRTLAILLVHHLIIPYVSILTVKMNATLGHAHPVTCAALMAAV